MQVKANEEDEEIYASKGNEEQCNKRWKVNEDSKEWNAEEQEIKTKTKQN